MRNRWLGCALIASAVAAEPLAGQRPGAGAAADSAMAPLAWLIGEWEGKATSQGREGPSSATVRESVQGRMNGRVLVIEGIGREPSADGSGRIVHHAFGLLTYDPERRQYAFRALRDGGVIDAETVLEDGVFTWGFAVPGGRIRFRIRQENGEWVETGEYAADGSAWRQMLEMRLRRVLPAPEQSNNRE
jgi:hypothetical protein